MIETRVLEDSDLGELDESIALYEDVFEMEKFSLPGKGEAEIFVQADEDDLDTIKFYQSTEGLQERVFHFSFDIKKIPTWLKLITLQAFSKG